ncbi:MAG: hypothetical protein WCE90_12700 [Candidatus Zixiibacteriota bacterium]
MKKIKKQPPVTPERSETPVSQIRYVLLYEQQSSYFSRNGKKLRQPPVTPEMSVTSVSRVRYVLWFECYSSCSRTTEKMKNSRPQVQHAQQAQPVGGRRLTASELYR